MVNYRKQSKTEKAKFKKALKKLAANLFGYTQSSDGEWTIKGFIDIYKNIYTISADTKIVSKLLEIHLFPKILAFAQNNDYIIQLTDHQNWYPDLTFIKKK